MATCRIRIAVGQYGSDVFAAVINVSAQDNLNDALARAQAGDTLKLASGTYKTKLYIDKPITIEGPADRSAKIVGDRSGRTVAVHAPDVTLRNPDRFPFRHEFAGNGCRYLFRRDGNARAGGA